MKNFEIHYIGEFASGQTPSGQEASVAQESIQQDRTLTVESMTPEVGIVFLSLGALIIAGTWLNRNKPRP